MKFPKLKKKTSRSKKCTSQSSYQTNLDPVSYQKEFGQNCGKPHLKIGNNSYVFDSNWHTDGTNTPLSTPDTSTDKHSMEAPHVIENNVDPDHSQKIKDPNYGKVHPIPGNKSDVFEDKKCAVGGSNTINSAIKKSPDKHSTEVQQLVVENSTEVQNLVAENPIEVQHLVAENSIEVQQLVEKSRVDPVSCLNKNDPSYDKAHQKSGSKSYIFEVRRSAVDSFKIPHSAPKKLSDKYSTGVQKLLGENNVCSFCCQRDNDTNYGEARLNLRNKSSASEDSESVTDYCNIRYSTPENSSDKPAIEVQQVAEENNVDLVRCQKKTGHDYGRAHKKLGKKLYVFDNKCVGDGFNITHSLPAKSSDKYSTGVQKLVGKNNVGSFGCQKDNGTIYDKVHLNPRNKYASEDSESVTDQSDIRHSKPGESSKKHSMELLQLAEENNVKLVYQQKKNYPNNDEDNPQLVNKSMIFDERKCTIDGSHIIHSVPRKSSKNHSTEVQQLIGENNAVSVCCHNENHRNYSKGHSELRNKLSASEDSESVTDYSNIRHSTPDYSSDKISIEVHGVVKENNEDPVCLQNETGPGYGRAHQRLGKKSYIFDSKCVGDGFNMPCSLADKSSDKHSTGVQKLIGENNVGLFCYQKDNDPNYDIAHLNPRNKSSASEDSESVTDDSNIRHSKPEKSSDKHSMEVQKLAEENKIDPVRPQKKKYPNYGNSHQNLRNNLYAFEDSNCVGDGFNITHLTPKMPSNKLSIEIQLVEENPVCRQKKNDANFVKTHQKIGRSKSFMFEDTKCAVNGSHITHSEPKKIPDKFSSKVQHLVDGNNVGSFCCQKENDHNYGKAHLKLRHKPYASDDSESVTDDSNIRHLKPGKSSNKHLVEIQKLVEENNIDPVRPQKKKYPNYGKSHEKVASDDSESVTDDSNIRHSKPGKSSDKHSIEVQKMVEENNVDPVRPQKKKYPNYGKSHQKVASEDRESVTDDSRIINSTSDTSMDKHSLEVQQLVEENNVRHVYRQKKNYTKLVNKSMIFDDRKCAIDGSLTIHSVPKRSSKKFSTVVQHLIDENNAVSVCCHKENDRNYGKGHSELRNKLSASEDSESVTDYSNIRHSTLVNSSDKPATEVQQVVEENNVDPVCCQKETGPNCGKEDQKLRNKSDVSEDTKGVGDGFKSICSAPQKSSDKDSIEVQQLIQENNALKLKVEVLLLLLAEMEMKSGEFETLP